VREARARFVEGVGEQLEGNIPATIAAVDWRAACVPASPELGRKGERLVQGGGGAVRSAGGVVVALQRMKTAPGKQKHIFLSRMASKFMPVLTSMVKDERKTVSFSWLARELAIPAEDAKG
jgi:hypothetical protein